MIVVDEQASRYQMNHSHNHPTASSNAVNTASRPLTQEMLLATIQNKTPRELKKKVKTEVKTYKVLTQESLNNLKLEGDEENVQFLIKK